MDLTLVDTLQPNELLCCLVAPLHFCVDLKKKKIGVLSWPLLRVVSLAGQTALFRFTRLQIQ